MNIEQANSIVADLLDEESYDEFKHKLPDFYDHAQKQIATTVGHITRVIEFTPELTGEYDVSERVQEILNRKLYRVRRILSDGDSALRLFKTTYSMQGGVRHRLIVDVYPETVTESTPVSYEFEIPEEAQPALTYYAAAHCTTTDNDKGPYYAFMDRYNNILQNMADAQRDSVSISIVKLGGESYGI